MPEEPGDTLDFREAMLTGGPVNRTISFVSHVARRDEGVYAAMMPLAFGAAWKVLDLLMELALAKEGRRPDLNRGFSISEKVRLARQGAGERGLLGVDTMTWQGLCLVYANMAEHRHCLVHRQASFTEAPLRLTGHAKSGQPLIPVEEKALKAFIHLAQIAGNGVLESGVNARSVQHIHYLLNLLVRHSGVTMPAGAPLVPVLVAKMILQPAEQDGWIADFGYLHEQMARRVPGQHVDVWIDIPGEVGRTLFGRLEEIPNSPVTLRLGNLPSYLTIL